MWMNQGQHNLTDFPPHPNTPIKQTNKQTSKQEKERKKEEKMPATEQKEEPLMVDGLAAQTGQLHWSRGNRVALSTDRGTFVAVISYYFFLFLCDIFSLFPSTIIT
jgi:hypothetical protein